MCVKTMKIIPKLGFSVIRFWGVIRFCPLPWRGGSLRVAGQTGPLCHIRAPQSRELGASRGTSTLEIGSTPGLPVGTHLFEVGDKTESRPKTESHQNPILVWFCSFLQVSRPQPFIFE